MSSKVILVSYKMRWTLNISYFLRLQNHLIQRLSSSHALEKVLEIQSFSRCERLFLSYAYWDLIKLQMHKSLCSHLVDVCEIPSLLQLPSLLEEVCILLILLVYFLLLRWQILQKSFCTNSILHSPLSSHFVPFCPHTLVPTPARLQRVLLESLLQAASATPTWTLLWWPRMTKETTTTKINPILDIDMVKKIKLKCYQCFYLANQENPRKHLLLYYRILLPKLLKNFKTTVKHTFFNIPVCLTLRICFS